MSSIKPSSYNIGKRQWQPTSKSGGMATLRPTMYVLYCLHETKNPSLPVELDERESIISSVVLTHRQEAKHKLSGLIF